MALLPGNLPGNVAGGDGKDVTHTMWGFLLPSLNNLHKPHPIAILIDFSSPFLRMVVMDAADESADGAGK